MIHACEDCGSIIEATGDTKVSVTFGPSFCERCQVTAHWMAGLKGINPKARIERRGDNHLATEAYNIRFPGVDQPFCILLSIGRVGGRRRYI